MIFKRLILPSLLFVTFSSSVHAQSQLKVLAELFRNINCGNCQSADNAYETYRASHPGIVVINYHNSNTDPNDPFYVQSKPSSENRDKFYNPSGNADPAGSIDGAGTVNTEGQWETFSNIALGHPLPLITT